MKGVDHCRLEEMYMQIVIRRMLIEIICRRYCTLSSVHVRYFELYCAKKGTEKKKYKDTLGVC
jgi:hypothetical protein